MSMCAYEEKYSLCLSLCQMKESVGFELILEVRMVISSRCLRGKSDIT